MALTPVAQTPWYDIPQGSNGAKHLYRIQKLVNISLFIISIITLVQPTNPYLPIICFGFVATQFTIGALTIMCIHNESRSKSIQLFMLLLVTVSTILFAWGAFGCIGPLVGPILNIILFTLVISIPLLTGLGLLGFLGIRYIIEN